MIAVSLKCIGYLVFAIEQIDRQTYQHRIRRSYTFLRQQDTLPIPFSHSQLSLSRYKAINSAIRGEAAHCLQSAK